MVHGGVDVVNTRNQFSRRTFKRLSALLMLSTWLVFYYGLVKGRIIVSGDDDPVRIGFSLGIGAILYMWTKKRDRNWVSIALISVFPALLFEVVVQSRLLNHIPRVCVFGACISLCAAAVYAVFRSGREVSMKDQYKTILIGRTIRAALVLYCFILLGASLYGRNVIKKKMAEHLVEVLREASEIEKKRPEGKDDPIAEHLETISQLDVMDGWMEWDINHKVDILSTVVGIECNRLGMTDSAPSLKLVHIDNNARGFYDKEDDSIALSYVFVDSASDGYVVVQTLCHELYHRYQYYLVNALRTIRKMDKENKYTDLSLFEAARTYETEMETYESENSMKYWLQRMERDSREYGECRADSYREAVRNHFSQD